MMCYTRENKAEELQSIIRNNETKLNVEGRRVRVTTGCNIDDENYYIFIESNEKGRNGINLQALKRDYPVEEIKNVRASSQQMLIQVELEE